MNLNAYPILTVLIIATLSSMLAEIPLRFRVPMVVWEMIFGMIVGPHLLGWARPIGEFELFGQRVDTYTLLAERGLAALFFMAGLELDLKRVRGRPLRLATGGWVISLAIALAMGLLLRALPFVHTPLVISLALTTTALGTFLPSLQDAGLLETKFGTNVLAVGVIGEFLPILTVPFVLTSEVPVWEEAGFMLGFAALAVLAAVMAVRVKKPAFMKLLRRTMHSSSQLPVLLALVVLFSFAVLSKTIGLEHILGAFSAGMILRVFIEGGEKSALFLEKIGAVCFGFLIPFFFVWSGMTLDLSALVHNANHVLLIPVFLALFLLVRGAPAILYRKELTKKELLPLALYSGTALPLVVAITNVAIATAGMNRDIATAMVGAGVLSVLIFPAAAQALLAGSSSTQPKHHSEQHIKA